MNMKVCTECDKELTGYQQKFCSRSCSAKVNNRNRKPRNDESRLRTAHSVCKAMGIEYTPKVKRVSWLALSEAEKLRYARIKAIWHSMRYRCYNKSYSDYRYYGAKGVRISEPWHIFENFYHDMAPSWFEGASIDRITSSGNYCPENCQWLPIKLNCSKRG